MHRLAIRWLCAALALGSAVLPSLAASALEPPDLERYVRWGPFRVRPGIELTNLGYDDNIFVDNANRVGDYTATLGPRVDGLLLIGRRAFVTFREQLQYTAYADNTDQNFVNNRTSARATVPLGRFGIFTEGLYNRLKERPLDAQDIRADRDVNGLGFGVILAPGPRTEIELGQLRQRLRFADEDADPTASGPTIGDQLDRTETRDSLTLRWEVLGRTRLTLDAYVTDIDFDRAFAVGRSSRERGVLPGIDFGEGGPLSGSLRVGPVKIDATDPALADFDEITGRARLAYRANSRTTLRLDAVREPGFSLSQTSTFFLNTDTRLGAVYYLNRIVGVEAAGSTGRLTFPGAGGTTAREDRVGAYEGGLRLRLAERSSGQRIEYSLKIRRYRRDSNVPGQDRSQTIWGVGAVLGF